MYFQKNKQPKNPTPPQKNTVKDLEKGFDDYEG